MKSFLEEVLSWGIYSLLWKTVSGISSRTNSYSRSDSSYSGIFQLAGRWSLAWICWWVWAAPKTDKIPDRRVFGGCHTFTELYRDWNNGKVYFSDCCGKAPGQRIQWNMEQCNYLEDSFCHWLSSLRRMKLAGLNDFKYGPSLSAK